MMALTILVVGLAVFAAAMTNAAVQGRLLAQGGRWLPSTLKSGLCGAAVMISIIAGFFGIANVVVSLVG